MNFRVVSMMLAAAFLSSCGMAERRKTVFLIQCMYRADQIFPEIRKKIKTATPARMQLIDPEDVKVSTDWFGSSTAQVTYVKGVMSPVVCKGNIVTRRRASISYNTLTRRPRSGESWSF